MSPLERPFRPVDLTSVDVQAFDLQGLASDLMQESQFEQEGRAGVSLARDSHVAVVLEVLRAGAEMREHRAPSSALVTLLSGRATFVCGPDDRRTDMHPGTLVAFSAGLDHAVTAEDDSILLIVIGGRRNPS